MNLYNLKSVFAILAIAAITISCDSDDSVVGTPTSLPPDFTGTFEQEDQMGRPGINTVFTPTTMDENNFNVTIPANQLSFQPTFQARIEAYYTAYGAMYENNILGLDLPTLTTALALDVLQVAPDADTSYFNPNTGVPLTGRTLEDDVIDVSLILLFGGNSGDRFSGQDTDGDGMPDLPNLVTDNVGIEAGVATAGFPYLTAAQ